MRSLVTSSLDRWSSVEKGWPVGLTLAASALEEFKHAQMGVRSQCSGWGARRFFGSQIGTHGKDKLIHSSFNVCSYKTFALAMSTEGAMVTIARSQLAASGV